MIAWLTDTFAYTALLIALVMVLRRPVARHFGAQTAYGLWALPLLRLLIPPIVLPASLAPVDATPITTVVPVEAAPAEAIFVPAANTATVPWAALVVAAWLFGAALFLGWRCWSYFRMRDELLAGSRPVGEAGDVRLIETPALTGPVAFGVFDKVVALPMDFMALEDRAARDLAIEHELAHHRGRDLLANVLAQPLLALHWFNPLAWTGWRAMRRDQEAACDARVIARRTPAERAHYGRVIASFAAGPRLALAAPMACPMAGRLWREKSIIHRLRSLNMSDISPRRRLTGRALWVGAALVLPLTASVSYAVAPAPEAPEVPAAPEAPAASPAPMPEAPEALGERKYTWRTHDGRRGDKVVTMTVRDAAPGETPRDAEGHPVPEPAFELAPITPVAPVAPVAMSEEQRRKFEEMGKQFAEQGQQWAQWGARFGQQFGENWSREWQKNAEKWARQAREQAEKAQKEWQRRAPQAFAYAAPDIQVNCVDNGAPAAAANNGAPGSAFARCRQYAHASARHALERAKASIAGDQGLSGPARDEVLQSLDREIERIDSDRNDTDTDN